MFSEFGLIGGEQVARPSRKGFDSFEGEKSDFFLEISKFDPLNSRRGIADSIETLGRVIYWAEFSSARGNPPFTTFYQSPFHSRSHSKTISIFVLFYFSFFFFLLPDISSKYISNLYSRYAYSSFICGYDGVCLLLLAYFNRSSGWVEFQRVHSRRETLKFMD